MEQEEQRSEFSDVKERLEEIARLVADDDMPLDDALDLYEEAVKLGLKASDLLEVGIVVEEDPEADAAGPAPQAGPELGQTPHADPVGAQTSALGSPQATNGDLPGNDDVATQA